MFSTLRHRGSLALAALALAGLLCGCVAYPANPGYGYYDGGYYSAPYYGGGVVAFGGGWHGHDGGRHHGWHH